MKKSYSWWVFEIEGGDYREMFSLFQCNTLMHEALGPRTQWIFDEKPSNITVIYYSTPQHQQPLLYSRRKQQLQRD